MKVRERNEFVRLVEYFQDDAPVPSANMPSQFGHESPVNIPYFFNFLRSSDILLSKLRERVSGGYDR